MNVTTYKDNKIVETCEAVGTEMVTKDGDGVVTGRRPLTDEEIAQIAAEGQPTPDETLVTDINAAVNLDDVKAALIKRFGG